MSSNSFGKAFTVTLFGESHGPSIGVVIDGCPAGLPIREEDFQLDLDRRIPSDPEITSSRIERDRVEIISGVREGFTTGAPVCLIVRNREMTSEDYEQFKDMLRPGHADYTIRIKYRGFGDLRGGGRASGRVTVGLVVAGVIARRILRQFGVNVVAHTIQIQGERLDRDPPNEEILANAYTNSVRCADPEVARRMRDVIIRARKEGDSVGGIVECRAWGVPAGVGEPFFDTLEGDLAKIAFSIPSVKGVEFGAGFKASSMKGSEHNDPFVIQEGKIVMATNNAGGILGGISTGMPIIMRVAVKPVSSIEKEQRTVKIREMKETRIIVSGRHDPCAVPKIVPVLEATVSIVLVDHMIRMGLIPRVLTQET